MIKNKITDEEKQKINDFFAFPENLTHFKVFEKNFKLKLTAKEKIKKLLGKHDENNFECWAISIFGEGFLVNYDKLNERVNFLGKKRDFI